jgi:predicted DNA-binding protein with PD1-like motif
MKSKKLGSATVLVFDPGDEVVSTLTKFAQDNCLSAGHFTAIGAFSDAGIGYYDWPTKKYLRHGVNEQVEVISLIGDIALDSGEPKIHAHVVVGKKNGAAVGGHLMDAHVRPTLELVLEELPTPLKRKFDPKSGLALIDLDGLNGENDR